MTGPAILRASRRLRHSFNHLRDFSSLSCPILQIARFGAVATYAIDSERRDVCFCNRYVHIPPSTYLSIAYLPSTFAMYGVTLAHAISLKPASATRTVKVFTTIGVTAIFSWPFAAALASVLALQEIADSEWTRARFLQLFHGIIVAVSLVFLVLVLGLFVLTF